MSGVEVLKCGCGTLNRLDELYYCSGCQGLKCFHCVNEEIECICCPVCLRYVTVAECGSNKSRCATCFQCPRCECPAKMVTEEEGKLCFLKCVHCDWDSKAVAVAPSPADLLMVLREQERGGVESKVYQERLAIYRKSVEDASAELSRQEQQAKMKKTHHLLVHTPAKSKFFSKGVGRAKGSPLRVNLESAFENASKKSDNDAARTDVDAIAKLEEVLDKKNKQQFGGHAELKTTTSSTTTKQGPLVVIESAFPNRQLLVSSTSKHCNACDKLLVKPEVNSAMEFKRLHVAYLFVAHVKVFDVRY